jgi:hypothetical protein
MIYRLGKQPKEEDDRNLKMFRYLVPADLPPLPPNGTDLYQKVSKLGPLGNLDYGDCVVAGAAHQVQVWSANAAREQIIPDQKVIATYLSLTGGRDIGLNTLEFLKYWLHNPLWEHPLGAFMEINPRSIRQLRYAVYLFGGALLGFNLPISAQGQGIWDVPPGGATGAGEPGSWGGHLTQLGAWKPGKPFTISTWDLKQPTSARFISTYCDEAYVCLALDWFTKDHVTPMGFNWALLKADLQKIKEAA